MEVRDEKALGKAVHNDVDTIVIEGDLAKKVLRIKATGKIAWAIAIGAISVAIPIAIATVGSGGTAAPVTVPAEVLTLTAPAAVLGVGTTASAVSIAVGAASLGGVSAGVGALNKLRKYKLKKVGKDRVILTRK